MARPKLGEGETQRLQLKISDEELAAIDDWRFENRISSRSEAVRRLCQAGLQTSGQLPTLAKEILALSDRVSKLEEDYVDYISKLDPENFDIHLASVEVARLLVNNIYEIHAQSLKARATVVDFVDQSDVIKGAPDIATALKIIERLRVDSAERRKTWEGISERFRRGELPKWQKGSE